MTALGYLLLAVALTWPLARHATTHVVHAQIAAFGDPWVLAWSLAWLTRTLIGHPHGGIYHPTPDAAFYGEIGIGALPLYAPPFLLTGNPVLAVNVVFLGGLALTAWSLHRAVARWTGSAIAGTLSGWTFLCCPFAAWAWGPSAVNYVTLWYWPWIVVLAATTTPRVGSTALLAALVFLQGLSSGYVAAALAGPMVLLATWRLVRGASRVAGWHLLAALGLAVIGWSAVYAPYVRVRLADPDLMRRTLYPFFAALPAPVRLFEAGEPSGVAPAAFALIVAGGVVALVRGTPHAAAWLDGLLWTLAALVLALPPRADVLGHAVLTPIGWLAAAGVPIDAVRDDGRRGLAALVALCMLAGIGWAELRRWHASAVPLAVVAAAGIAYGLVRPVERLAAPAPTPGRYPLLEVRAARRIESPVMDVLRRPGGPLLELPTAPGPIVHADAMHRAAVHGRALLNGQQGYWPAGFAERMALACRLPDEDTLAALRRETGVELILVHLAGVPFGAPIGPYACPPRALGAPAAPGAAWNRATWEAIARDGHPSLALVVRDGDDLLFRVRVPDASRRRRGIAGRAG